MKVGFSNSELLLKIGLGCTLHGGVDVIDRIVAVDWQVSGAECGAAMLYWLQMKQHHHNWMSPSALATGLGS